MRAAQAARLVQVTGAARALRTHAAEQTAVARTALVAAAEVVQQATSTAAATAPQASTADAAPAATAGTQTTPVASVSPTTAQEGTIMSDPIDDTLEHVGRHAGRSGQTIASEAGRQIQRANDERRRALQEAQRNADRDREQAVREAQRKAEREKDQADRLERRYPTADTERQQDSAAAAATSAVLGDAAADAIDDAIDRQAAAIQSDGRDETAVETTANDTMGGKDLRSSTTSSSFLTARFCARQALTQTRSRRPTPTAPSASTRRRHPTCTVGTTVSSGRRGAPETRIPRRVPCCVEPRRFGTGAPDAAVRRSNERALAAALDDVRHER